MISFIIGIALLLGLIGLAIWSGRGTPTNDGGSNVDAARRCGGGLHR